MKSSGLEVGPKSSDRCPYKERRKDTGGREEGRSHVKREGEDGETQPQGKERLEPPGVGTGEEGILS